MKTHTPISHIKVGISACLTGEEVRFDKSHKKSNFCMNELANYVSYKTFCPEVAIGMPVPRPTIRQIKRDDIIHISRPDGSNDVTQPMQEYAENVASKISDLSGFIFTAKSPSCGMERVKVYFDHGKGSLSTGVGIFAKAIMAANPLMPCEENGRLNDPAIRENFVLRLYAYKNWQIMVSEGVTKHKLFTFHSHYKYLLMSHSSREYSQLGKLLATHDGSLQETADQYIAGFMEILKRKASKKTHTNTLQHLQGYFSKRLSREQRIELTEQINAYRLGLVPLVVPITLLKHYLLEFPTPYLDNQVYFDPYPAELKLRYGY